MAMIFLTLPGLPYHGVHTYTMVLACDTPRRRLKKRTSGKIMLVALAGAST